MKDVASKLLTAVLLFILASGLNNALKAQIEDDQFLQDYIEEEEDQCEPESLRTIYDEKYEGNLKEDIRLIYNFGYEYFKNKSYKEALPYLWQVFINDSTDRYARASVGKIADIYYSNQNVDSTLIICYRGLDRFPDMTRLHYYAGILQRTLGKFRCAIPHYEALVEKDSGNVNYLEILSFLYFKDDNEEAVDIQKKVVGLKPDSPEASQTLAQYSNHFYGEGAGLEAFGQAWRNDPENLDMAMQYAKSAVRSGASQKALEPLNKVIEQRPDENAYETRARAYENLGENSKAIQDLKSIIDMGEKDPDIMLKIANNYKILKNFSNARYWVQQALSAKPGYGKAHIVMGEIYEAAVSYCQEQTNGKKKFQHKLVYELAWREYEKAKNDPSYRSDAKKKQGYVEPLTPSKEDKFMHPGEQISLDCYSWIK